MAELNSRTVLHLEYDFVSNRDLLFDMNVERSSGMVLVEKRCLARVGTVCPKDSFEASIIAQVVSYQRSIICFCCCCG